MLVDMALLAYLAYNYKYVNINGNKSEDSVDTNENIPMEEKPSKSDSWNVLHTVLQNKIYFKVWTFAPKFIDWCSPFMY